jgi:abequosyltransferase
MELIKESIPLLSICIPTFNRRKYLQECFESIITQDGFNEQDIEIVISDNASEDDTSSLVYEYMNRYSNIVYHRNEENIGADRNVLQIL